MAEYISREAAIEIAMQYCPDDDGSCSKGLADLRDMLDEIESIPAADVRPVRRGEWEEDCAGAAICSVCGKYAFETSTHHLCGWFPSFYPSCGARMSDEEEQA